MYKRIVFTTLICFSFASSFSQILSSQRKEDYNINKFYTTTVPINSPADSISIAIRSISVVDARPDSSAFGLIQIYKLDPRFIVTKGNFARASTIFLNKYIQCAKSDSFSVLMVLRKFWIATDVKKVNDQRIWDLDEDTSKEIKVTLFARIEFYLYKDSFYYALYRFDSVFSADAKKSMSIAGNIDKPVVRNLVQDVMETSISKLANMDSRWQLVISSKRKFTRQEIDAHDQKYFETPILKDSSLVPGIYLTFEEFKNNEPSVREFQVTMDKLNDIAYVRQPDGKQIALREAWGFCDSSHHVYIRSSHNYFKLQRRQNAFYIYGSNQTSHNINNQPASLPSVYSGTPQTMPAGNYRSESFKLQLRPFQLDWDNGKLE